MATTQDGSRAEARPCPVCAGPMDVATERGVKVDVCAEHGIWLDNGELDGILMARSRRSQLRKSRRRTDDRKDGIVRGALLGWWALLLE